MSNFISAIPPHGVTGASVYSTDNPILTIRLFGAIYATANSGFNGIQKKTQKTPMKELKKAEKIFEEYSAKQKSLDNGKRK